MRKRFLSKKIADELVIIDSKVIEIIENNKEHESGNIKNVFKCESSKNPDGQLCVLWGRTTVSAGDKIKMQGRFKDDVFLAWSLSIIQKAAGVCNG